MGNYLSDAYLKEPITDKISTDDDGERLRYGASSMQGWRVSQEDAHNCIIDFDKDTSLFAVYDGHGGHEVAVYSSQKLPDFIKETEAYKKGDYKNALIDAFLGFDSVIATKEVVEVLKEIAGTKNNDTLPTDVSSEDEENVSNLCEEASMPIEQVIEKYHVGLLNPNRKKLQGEKLPNSPYLRAPKSDSSASCSSDAGASSSKGADTSTDLNVVSSTNSDVSSSDTGSSKEKKELTSEAKVTKDENTSEAAETKQKDTSEATFVSNENHVQDSKKEIATTTGDDTLLSPDSSNTAAPSGDGKTKQNEVKNEINGEISITSKNENECSSTTTQENGDVKISPKGKGKAIKKIPEATTRPKSLRIRNAKQLYNKLLDFEEESDSEDENDENFEGAVSNSSSEAEDAAESSEGADDEAEEDEAEEDEEEEEDENLLDDEDDDDSFARNIKEEPSSDSGCTAVVALLQGSELYVANAGDSRCIICRNGQAIEMSFDHKPEDDPERDRIVKAGGKVTCDGRVNGGLNLSRAIGDHAYKQNKELSDREQMITALPDIKTLTINPEEDEFMVLACDGIWNFMSSQDVVEFVRPRLKENKEKLSEICEEMFDHCLAPDLMGDGTGCDNMTAIIIQFKHLRAAKRCASPIDPVESTNDTKRIKADESVV